MIGFVNTWFLVGLLAVSLPVIIHFLTRPKPKTIPFPTYRFLVEAASGKQALYRLRTRIILILRSLAVMMLVLLFARPFFGRHIEAGNSEISNRVAIIIDATPSMKAVKGGVTLFDKARAEAADFMRGLEKDTKAVLFFIKEKPHALLPAMSANISALHQGIQDVEAGFATSDPGLAIDSCRQLLAGSGSIVIFSDFQSTNWSESSFEKSENLPIILRPVIQTGVDNIAITRVEVLPANPVAGTPAEIAVTIFNCTERHRRESVSLFFLGERFSRSASLTPYSSTDLSFFVTPEEPGEFTGRVELGTKDALNDDNTRYFTIKARKESVVLVISDDDPKDLSGSSFFVHTAIEPYREEGGGGVKAIVRHSQDTDAKILDRAEVYIISPPVMISEKTAAAISSRVLEGAGLILFMDGNQAHGVLNALSKASEERITPPFGTGGVVYSSDKKGEPVKIIDNSRKPLALFAGPEESGLSHLRFTRHIKTMAISSREDEILMSYDDKSSALAVSKAGKGVVAYLNFSPTPNGGNLVSNPFFPAFLHECIRLGSNMAMTKTLPGKAMEITIPHLTGETEEYQVFDPDKNLLEHVDVSMGSHTKLMVSRVDKPGIYQVYRNEKIVYIEAVNIDPLESDTRTIPIRELTGSNGNKGQGKENRFVAHDTDELKLDKQKDLWPFAWIFLAVFAGLEMLVLALWRKK